MKTNIEANIHTHDGNLNSTFGYDIQSRNIDLTNIETSQIGQSGISNEHTKGFNLFGIRSQEARTEHLGLDGYQATNNTDFRIGGQSILAERGGITIDSNGIDLDYRLDIGGETVNCAHCIPDMARGIARVGRHIFSFFGNLNSCNSADIANHVVEAAHTAGDHLEDIGKVGGVIVDGVSAVLSAFD